MAKVGRKPQYTPDRVRIICDAIESGETNKHAAELAGLHQDTFYKWLKEKPEFSELVKKAQSVYREWLNKDILADAERSLKVLINGTEYEEIKTEYEQNPNNPDAPRIKKQSRTTKKILPNPTAVIFALCNRDPEHWQNRISQDVNGKIDVEQKGSGISLSNVPDSLLAQVIEAINGK
jgi:hypothetical protein